MSGWLTFFGFLSKIIQVLYSRGGDLMQDGVELLLRNFNRYNCSKRLLIISLITYAVSLTFIFLVSELYTIPLLILVLVSLSQIRESLKEKRSAEKGLRETINFINDQIKTPSDSEKFILYLASANLPKGIESYFQNFLPTNWSGPHRAWFFCRLIIDSWIEICCLLR